MGKNNNRKRYEEANRQQEATIAKSKQMWEDLGLKPCSYYVAEISWRSTNPPHRVIISTNYDPKDKVEIYSRNYENVDKAWIAGLHSFRLIAAIPQMNK